MQSGVLLDVAELLEAALAVGTLVRFLAGVHAYVLDQLVVGAERLETLLALVRFAHLQTAAAQRTSADAAGPAKVPGLDLHGRRLLHEYLRHKRYTVSIRQGRRQRRTAAAAAAAAAMFPAESASSRRGDIYFKSDGYNTRSHLAATRRNGSPRAH